MNTNSIISGLITWGIVAVVIVGTASYLGLSKRSAREKIVASSVTKSGVDERCINGVLYYSQIRGIAPAFKPDGTLYLCSKQQPNN